MPDGQGLDSLSGTILKLRADQERNQQGPGLLSPKSWVYLEDPPTDLRPHSSPRGGTSLVQVSVGPIVGTVTQTSAVILLEVDTSAAITLVLRKQGSEEQPRRLQRRLPADLPKAFHVEGLEPATAYDVSFEGLAECELEDLPCVVRTLPPDKQLGRMTVVALSCDLPQEIDDNTEENPYTQIACLPECVEEPLLFLHLGGQVHTSLHNCLQGACRILEDHDRVMPSLAQKKRERSLVKLQDAYRHTWSEDETKVVLAKGQRMMIWSDRDVAADFTVLAKGGENLRQIYHEELVKSAMKCYRRYQRQLWDPVCEGNLPERCHPVEEFQFRTFGPLGVFLIDMRGGRLTSSGQVTEGPIMTQRQRAAFSQALATPGMTGLIVGSEQPFVGDSPEEIKKKVAADPCGLSYLREQWPYNFDELVWLLEAVFAWKDEAPGRDVLMVSGGANTGVESVIHDRKGNATIRHVTTSPITSRTRPFDFDLRGLIGPRFTYTHKPLLQQRNFCQIDVSFTDGAVCNLTAELVGCKAKEMVTQGRRLAAPKKKKSNLP